MRLRLFAQNPNASAEELKQLLLAETISVDVTVEDVYYDEEAGSFRMNHVYFFQRNNDCEYSACSLTTRLVLLLGTTTKASLPFPLVDL